MEGRALNRPLGLDTFRMAFDSATVFTAQALPTPTGAPRQTPSRQSSQHDRRRRSSSPPPVPRDQSLQHENQKEVQNGQGDENISPLDPRRFTPTLHASLVSQILNLQREVESKNRTVHNLEEFLHITKKENEQLSESLKDQGKENRSIKKQMQLLESSTLDALGGIAKERDDANESLAETRSRLETSKSKNRIQEEEVERNQSLWDKERQNWEMERRNMETKVHVVEGRLKTVLAEIAAAQANGYEYPLSSVELDDSAHRTWYTKESDSTSSRSNSVKRHSRFSGLSNGTNEVSEYLNYRASTLSGLNGFGMNKRHGISLADELEFSAEEPDFEGDGTDEVMSPDALPEEAQFHRRRPSVQSISQDQKAWKLLGLLPENIEQAIKEEGLTEKTAAALQDNVTLTEKPSTEDERMSSAPTATAMQYVDSATQFSPPASPKLAPQAESIPSEKVAERALSIEHTANQSRKRVSAPLTEQTTDPKLISHTFVPMVSAGCQTVNQPPSPPLTPIIAIEPLASAPMRTESEVQMISSSMQTDEQRQIILAAAGAREKPSSMTIPVIEIHPPGSRPPSSHTSVVLPPRTKNAGCQASIVLPVLSRSISVQTEAVITGKRSLGSISNSMPKAVSQLSSPPNSLERIEERSPQPPQPAPRTSSRKHSHRSNENPRPLIKPSFSAPVIDTYPGNNDSGPLTSKQPTGLRRPVRSGSLFAGFDSSFTNDSLQLKDFDLSSDDDFATVAPIRKTLSKVQNSWKLVPQSDDEFMGRLGSAKNSVDNLDIDESSDPWLASLVPFGENENQIYKGIDKQTGKKSMIPSKTHGKSGMRQAAPLATAPGPKVPRARSPSAPSVPENDSNVAPPPFPVPTRSSSRRIPISASEGAQSPTPYSTTFFSTARKREVGKPLSRNPLRKVQSAAAVTRFGRNHAQMRTPTHTTSPSTLASDSPQLPKLPKNDITSRLKTDMQPVQQTTHILPVASLAEEASVDTPGQSTSVVDAIAQTMVGEWMWKYVRRRKSFGLTEDVDFDEKGNSNGNGFRHKRWVWLAPYERAVMWSSKQPTSGPALMGKSGRKLNIQSVLDVKDDAPMPKSSNPQTCFGRSILILTPQRALKFTATSRDRHYVWLTALSFLSHSPLGMDDLTTIPPLPPTEYQHPPSQPIGGGLRRSSIRDSIRVAKSKERPMIGSHAYSSPITTLHLDSLNDPRPPILADEPDSDAAEAPSIPRTAAQSRTHNRKRSSTGPRPAPPNSFHSFPTSAAMASTGSLKNPTIPSSDFSAFPPRDPGASSHGHRPPQLLHDPLPPLDPIRNNFFDAVGTVRMEAFVESKKKRRPAAQSLGNSWAGEKKTGKKDLRYWGVGGEKVAGDAGVMGMGLEDPFRGF